jgi:hypothetical protein
VPDAVAQLDPRAQLTQQVAEELAKPPPAAAAALAQAIVDRHGSGVASVLFYGSCLRKTTHEGVLDFYVVIDGYRDFYGLGWFCLANAALPPNVFYLESEAALEPGAEPTPVRCKYAVLSSAAFDRLTSARAMHPYIWARFAQPALLAWVRDGEARSFAERTVSSAVVTFVRRLSPFLPTGERVTYLALWKEAFRRTYGTEFRTESPERSESFYKEAPQRYVEVTALALRALQAEGTLTSVDCGPEGYELNRSPLSAFAAKARWKASWPVVKSISILRLLKTATTFGDWLPYALWKLERHGGERPELTERQRKHPLIFAWPVILRLLTKGALR